MTKRIQILVFVLVLILFGCSGDIEQKDPLMAQQFYSGVDISIGKEFSINRDSLSNLYDSYSEKYYIPITSHYFDTIEVKCSGGRSGRIEKYTLRKKHFCNDKNNINRFREMLDLCINHLGDSYQIYDTQFPLTSKNGIIIRMPTLVWQASNYYIVELKFVPPFYCKESENSTFNFIALSVYESGDDQFKVLKGISKYWTFEKLISFE